MLLRWRWDGVCRMMVSNGGLQWSHAEFRITICSALVPSMHLIASLLTKSQSFISPSLVDRESLFCMCWAVHSFVWRMIKCRAFRVSSLSLLVFKAQGLRAEQADVSLQCWQAHYKWPRENMKCPCSRWRREEKWWEREDKRQMKVRRSRRTSNRALFATLSHKQSLTHIFDTSKPKHS